MRIVPSADVIGAEIQDVNLAQPMSDETFAQIESAFERAVKMVKKRSYYVVVRPAGASFVRQPISNPSSPV